MSTNHEGPREKATFLVEHAPQPTDSVALALIYVGDQIGQIESLGRDQAIEKIGTELGGIGSAIGDVALELSQR
jgi:hypothetical protein